MGDCNHQIIHRFNSLNFSCPIAGVFAIGPDIFLYTKMLICAVPIHITVPAKERANFICVLLKNTLPEFNYINSAFSCIHPRLPFPVKASCGIDRAYNSRICSPSSSRSSAPAAGRARQRYRARLVMEVSSSSLTSAR